MLKIKTKLDALVQSVIDELIKKKLNKKKIAIAISKKNRLKQRNVNATDKKGIGWAH